MTRASEVSTASGRELISQTQDIWQESRDRIPQQQRQDLGQILTELGARITYTCKGQQPQQRSQYSTLGGAELASHAVKTAQRVATQLPVDWSRQLTWVITEMANRVRYAAEGEPQSQSQNGESFSGENFGEEQRQHMPHSSGVFA